MLTQDEVKELIVLYRAVEEGSTLQIQHPTGVWNISEANPVDIICRRLAKGIPASGIAGAVGALRIKPKSVRLYFNGFAFADAYSACVATIIASCEE